MGRHLPVPAAMDCAFGRWLRVAKPICCRVQPRRCGRAFSNDGRWFASSHVDHNYPPLGGRSSRYHPARSPTLSRFAPETHTGRYCSCHACRSPSSMPATPTSFAHWGDPTLTASMTASGGGDHPIRLLDSESGELYSLWHGHTHTIEALSFAPGWEVACQRKLGRDDLAVGCEQWHLPANPAHPRSL